MPRPSAPEIDMFERARPREGVSQEMDRRLFVQLLVFACEADLPPDSACSRLIEGLKKAQVPAVVYEDLANPRGLAVLTWNEDPVHFVGPVRTLLGEPQLCGLRPLPEFTMLGRTYATGYEPDLEHALLRKPVENATNAAHPWAVWYPLRRKGSFETLEPAEKDAIVREHATIGMAYGRSGHAHDVRLACHGLDANDNEFVIGLVSDNLHRLSHLVQRMRSTQQTSQYIEKMGPFFVGHAVWQNPDG